MKEKSKLFTGIATLTGTIIGAGFLGIPYVVSKSGFLIGAIWMLVICLIFMALNLMIGEIALSSKTIHHISGYASKYLGRKTKIFVFIASVIGFYAALVAYLMGEGESLSYLFFGSLNYSFALSLVFWIIMAGFAFKGIREFKKIEPIAVALVFSVTLVFGILNFSKINFSNLTYINKEFLFLPFGVILFSFLGVSSIPEIKRVLKDNEKLMKKSIIIGSFIPLIVYLLFTLVVLGLYGGNVFELATISLGKIVTILGIFTMFTAFLALSLALEDTYRFDFGRGFKTAWLLTISVPLILFLIVKIFNLAGFIKILSIGGSFSGGLLGIAILLIHEHLHDKEIRDERKPEFRIYIPYLIKLLIMILFVAGMLYEVL